MFTGRTKTNSPELFVSYFLAKKHAAIGVHFEATEAPITQF